MKIIWLIITYCGVSPWPLFTSIVAWINFKLNKMNVNFFRLESNLLSGNKLAKIYNHLNFWHSIINPYPFSKNNRGFEYNGWTHLHEMVLPFEANINYNVFQDSQLEYEYLCKNKYSVKALEENILKNEDLIKLMGLYWIYLKNQT